jgi:hypothetical protein
LKRLYGAARGQDAKLKADTFCKLAGMYPEYLKESQKERLSKGIERDLAVIRTRKEFHAKSTREGCPFSRRLILLFVLDLSNADVQLEPVLTTK